MAEPVVCDRSDFAFSFNGRYAVCRRTDNDGEAFEHWTLAPRTTRHRTLSSVPAGRLARALPLDDGRILLLRRGHGNESHRWTLALVQPTSAGLSVHELGTIAALLNSYLLPSPNAETLAWVVTADLEHSTIWRVPACLGPIQLVMRVPGLIAGGVWLDAEARTLGMNQTVHAAPSNGIAVDLARRSWTRIWSLSPASSEQIVLASPRSKLVILSTTLSGRQRLGWARLGDPRANFPDILHSPRFQREALALDPAGERLLVHEVTGAISRLLIYTPAQDHLEELPGPRGRVSAPAWWARDLLRVRFSAPGYPPTLATVRLGAPPEWSVQRGPENHPIRPAAEVVTLQGPAGPIEAIVYGGPQWQQREHLVVALHGGPISSWRFEFQPLFHHLSAAGVAILAPNYRGSTGYGAEHLRPMIGNWGGPDLDDVLDIGRTLHAARAAHLPRPIVLGASYGAFLALLAACHEPDLWSACVALAPFLSAQRFHQDANIAVRRRIEHLGGLRTAEETNGSRDVLAACPALTVPLLLLHGSADETVPVEQSRRLRRRLRELGKAEGIDFEYVEVDTDHYGLVCSQRDALNQRVVRFCLTRGQRKPLPSPLGSGTNACTTQRRGHPCTVLTW